MVSLDSAGVVTIDVETAKKLLDSGYPLLDIRTVEEFRRGHVTTEKIVNIPYQFNSPNVGLKMIGFWRRRRRSSRKMTASSWSLLAVGELQTYVNLFTLSFTYLG
ncbi:unnamed protein product [Citrullus colocynthis]|uniref:Rhodanese domain-containing protein n=1 Tax=Citrullus colocynthis TaxID=252529 RepID=A0ABP0YJU2_9ROSI